VLKLFYTNIDTLTNKLPELKLAATTVDYDILCICEQTPKNSSNPLAENHIRTPGYCLFSNLSISSRRGTTIYTKEGLQVRDLSFNHDYSPLVESCIYRSPCCPDAHASYQGLIQLAEQASNNDNQDFILLGDLKLPDVKWVERLGYQRSSNVSNPFLEYLGSNSLYQVIDQLTC
jgi:hypothetical protein